jgi:catechol 2,3-dioxygenase-like lactoylglutathione lyase family enzyme
MTQSPVPSLTARRPARRGAAAEAAAAVVACLLLAVAVGARAFSADSPPRFTPAAPAPAAATKQAAGPAAAVEAVTITVSDLDRAVAFYSGVLSFREEARDEHAGDRFERLVGIFGARARSARLRLGDERIALLAFDAPAGRPVPADSRSNDRWFQHIAIAVSDFERALDVLRRHDVRAASAGPQTLPAWNPRAGGISAFYFKDPDDHVLEIIHFPPGKGDPRWRRDTSALFLGIDHTAIVVADTDRSMAFYRDALGLSVAGETENYGVEQERLNNVFGARLRITTLRAPSGPGIELLEYLSPSNGREYPRDSTPADLWHWHVRLRPGHPDAERVLRRARARWVSAAPASPEQPLASFIVRDPDGHALLIPVAAATDPGSAAADR